MSLTWYATGTVSVTNGSPTVIGSGTSFVANVDGGQGFLGPDHSLYEIADVVSDTVITLATNYRGSTGAGGAYVIPPLQGYTRSAAQALASYLATAGQYANLVLNDNDVIQQKTGVLANRSPAQLLMDLSEAVAESTIGSAATCDIGNAATPKVQITGTTTISSFGAVANAMRFVRFAGALTLTHSSAMLLPGGVDKSVAAGDTAIFMSDASANWRCWSYLH